MNKKINEFDIDKLVVSVYNQIAGWHNDNGSTAELKQLSFDMITEIVGKFCEHLDIPYNGEIKIDGELKKEALKKYSESK